MSLPNSDFRNRAIAKAAWMLFAVIASCILAGCAKSADTAMGSESEISPQDPPLPRVASILPLEKGNQWTYSDTRYNVAGDVLGSRDQLDLEIARVYGRSGMKLIKLEWAYSDTFDEYVYAYEWEQTNRGHLVAYRDLDVAQKGVYIIGEYQNASARLYASARLWLAYPADVGTNYQVLLPDTADTVPFTMEIVSTDALFYCPLGGSEHVSAARFYDCYLYKQTKGNAVSYYYYNSEVGAVGYLRYEDGVLLRTYILTSFENHETYMYY
jgi:hypothetical protein